MSKTIEDEYSCISGIERDVKIWHWGEMRYKKVTAIDIGRRPPATAMTGKEALAPSPNEDADKLSNRMLAVMVAKGGVVAKDLREEFPETNPNTIRTLLRRGRGKFWKVAGKKRTGNNRLTFVYVPIGEE